MGKLEGKVALITGAGRGQGRAHAVRLAQDGADIIAGDLCAGAVDALPYALATEEDLQETVRQVEALGRRIVAQRADVRSLAQMEALVAAGVGELGRLDIVVANAGIASFGQAWGLTEEQFDDVIATNLTGAWKTARAAVPAILERDEGGAIVFTGSTASTWGTPFMAHYVAAKHGIIGLTKVFSNELAPHSIRVNAVCPTTVDTDMVHSEGLYRLFNPEVENPGREDMAAKARELQSLPIPWIEASDVANAVAWLVSDEARYVTGIALPVDAGSLTK